MKSIIAGAALVVAATFIILPSAHAANVTPDVIFGGGNDNGDFTVATGSGIELGLRAKQRFPKANIFNYDGGNTYNFFAGSPSPGFSFANDADTPLWNFEWSINSDVNDIVGDAAPARALNELQYLLSIDFDPSTGPSSSTLSFDPINPGPADHALGDNNTGNGGGVSDDTAATYAANIGILNVAQNSWNLVFFSAFDTIDPNQAGTYTISLAAFDGDSTPVVSTSIDVVVGPVPVPAALPLFLSGLLGLGIMARRRRKALA